MDARRSSSWSSKFRCGNELKSVFFVLLVIMQSHVCPNCFSCVQLSLSYMLRAHILSMRLRLSLYMHRKLNWFHKNLFFSLKPIFGDECVTLLSHQPLVPRHMGDLLSPFGVKISTPSQYDCVCVIQLHGTRSVKGIGIGIQINASLLTLMVHLFLPFNLYLKINLLTLLS